MPSSGTLASLLKTTPVVERLCERPIASIPQRLQQQGVRVRRVHLPITDTGEMSTEPSPCSEPPPVGGVRYESSRRRKHVSGVAHKSRGIQSPAKLSRHYS